MNCNELKSCFKEGRFEGIVIIIGFSVIALMFDAAWKVLVEKHGDSVFQFLKDRTNELVIDLINTIPTLLLIITAFIILSIYIGCQRRRG